MKDLEDNNEEKNTDKVVEDSEKLNELKKEIESQMGEVQDILAGNNENVLKFDEIPSVSSLGQNSSSETMVVHTDDIKSSIETDTMSTAVVETINTEEAKNNIEENANVIETENSEIPAFDGGKTEIIKSVDVDRNFAHDSAIGENPTMGPKPRKKKKSKG